MDNDLLSDNEFIKKLETLNLVGFYERGNYLVSFFVVMTCSLILIVLEYGEVSMIIAISLILAFLLWAFPAWIKSNKLIKLAEYDHETHSVMKLRPYIELHHNVESKRIDWDGLESSYKGQISVHDKGMLYATVFTVLSDIYNRNSEKG